MVNWSQPNQNYTGMAPQQMQKFGNNLTGEEIDGLQKKGAAFSLFPTEEEALRGVCNHRSKDGTTDALMVDQATGEVVCSICGYRFHMLEPNLSADDIKDVVSDLIDILQTIKFMYVDLPVEASRKYFQIIPLLEKVPKLYEYAGQNFSKHNLTGWSYQNQNMGAYNMFMDMQNHLGNGIYGGYQQAPYGINPNMATGAAGYPGMVYGNPAYAGTPQPNGGNAFGFAGASQQQAGYQPNTTGYQYQAPTAQPAQASAAATPAPDAKAAEPTTTVVQQVKA